MKGKLLLFGFEDLFSAPAIIAAVEPLGLEVVRVPQEDYGRKLEELAGLTPRKAKGTPYAGGPLGDKMIVLCGLGNQLDELLPVLRRRTRLSQSRADRPQQKVDGPRPADPAAKRAGHDAEKELTNGPKGPGCAVPVLFCRTQEKRLAFYGKLR